MFSQFKSVIELLKEFPTEKSCLDHLEKILWQSTPKSPFVNNSKIYSCGDNKYICSKTRKYFNVKTGTMFHKTLIGLQPWFVAIFLVTSHKKGISSVQLAKDLNVSQKTAWFMLQRIRNCFGIDKDIKFSNPVEIDESFVGGKNKNRHIDKKVKQCQGRSYKDKSVVLGMVERGGKVLLKMIPDTKKKTLEPEITQRIEKNTTIFTDDWKGYKDLYKRYNHKIYNHKSCKKIAERSDADTHTNNIEGFWSILKRGIIGIYHRTSHKHLQKYLDEFSFRYNYRSLNSSEIVDLFLRNCNKRLTYKMLVNG